MNRGALIFLGLFFALAGSWYGMVLQPQAELGRLAETKTVGAEETYPVLRPGQARQGAGVYVANGCVYCHSQQVRQTGTALDVVLAASGTNRTQLVASLRRLKPELSENAARELVEDAPKTVLQNVSSVLAEEAAKSLAVGGARAVIQPIPLGLDIARGWGVRRTVAEDYLYDCPVQLGSLRIGPDLANAGLRRPDPQWHLRHLYAPGSEVKGSTMPPYRYLFETHKIARAPSPEALKLPAAFAPAPGYEVVPRPAAKSLVAYLLSLRADAPLFETPATLAPAAAATKLIKQKLN